MEDVRFGHQKAEKIMYMCGKALEAHLIAHEAMYVDEK